MAVGILDRKPFRRGGGVEFGIGREQRQRRVSCMDFQGRRELHGIIASHGMPSRQPAAWATSPADLDGAVLAGEIELEIRQGSRGVLGRDQASTLPPRDGGHCSASVIRTTKCECRTAGPVGPAPRRCRFPVGIA